MSYLIVLRKIAAKYWTGDWELVDNSAGNSGVTSSDFRLFFDLSPSKIVKRICSNCDEHHKEMYYRRHTSFPESMKIDELLTEGKWHGSTIHCGAGNGCSSETTEQNCLQKAKDEWGHKKLSFPTSLANTGSWSYLPTGCSVYRCHNRDDNAGDCRVYWNTRQNLAASDDDYYPISGGETKNTMGLDYDLFNTYSDAVAGTNAWSVADYEGKSGGAKFPGKSGRCQQREDGTNYPLWSMYVDMQAVANAESKLSVCQPPLNGVLADSATMDTADARPWWIVAIRRDVDRLQLWLNGEKDADAAILGAPDDSFTAPMMLGGDDRTSVGFSGDVAEFLLYETDLSDRDVLDITASLSTKWGTGRSSVAGVMRQQSSGDAADAEIAAVSFQYADFQWRKVSFTGSARGTSLKSACDAVNMDVPCGRRTSAGIGDGTTCVPIPGIPMELWYNTPSSASKLRLSSKMKNILALTHSYGGYENCPSGQTIECYTKTTNSDTSYSSSGDNSGGC